MNKLPTAKRAEVVRCLVEGNSIRGTVRMTGAAKNTVIKLLLELGEACGHFQDAVLRNLPCKRIQADEIWTFCYAKFKHVPEEHQGEFGYGDVWTFTALDADTKLVASWAIGPRTYSMAAEFVQDLVPRLAHRVQLTTNGASMYLNAVEEAFGADVDIAVLQKIYGPADETPARYSPPECIGTVTQIVQGDPKPEHISTSFVNRSSLTMRMSMRRFTRLTNGFSKKLHNLMAAVSLHFMHYNFCRLHQSLSGKTPAMAAGVADRTWFLEEVVALLDSN